LKEKGKKMERGKVEEKMLVEGGATPAFTHKRGGEGYRPRPPSPPA